jgi:hypothetical protein
MKAMEEKKTPWAAERTRVISRKNFARSATVNSFKALSALKEIPRQAYLGGSSSN